MQTTNLTTKDSIKLVADYYEAASDRAVILLHSNRTNRKDLSEFAAELNSLGYQVLNLDLRGHGDSQGVHSEFTNADYIAHFNDALAAEEYLHNLNPLMKIQMVGASIGANTAIRFQETNTVESVVALSPSFDFFGIETTDANLSNIACPIFYINSKGDKWSSETKVLFEQSPLINDKNKLLIIDGDGHGTDLLVNEHVNKEVVAWLNNH